MKKPENVPLFAYQIPLFESIIFNSSENVIHLIVKCNQLFIFIIRNSIPLNNIGVGALMMILRYQETLKSLGFSFEMNCDAFTEFKMRTKRNETRKINNKI